MTCQRARASGHLGPLLDLQSEASARQFVWTVSIDLCYLCILQDVMMGVQKH